jgi:hypothetical protein
MRSDKELLELVLKEFPEMFKTNQVNCLCYCVNVLLFDMVITYEEERRLKYIFAQNITDYYINQDTGYYFPKGEIEPRQEYLKQLIEKYK